VAEYAQLADAFVLRQDFGQRRRRPAAARQFGVEFGVTASHARRRHTAEFSAAPDRRMRQQCSERIHQA